jgi:hypothetical protein
MGGLMAEQRAVPFVGGPADGEVWAIEASPPPVRLKVPQLAGNAAWSKFDPNTVAKPIVVREVVYRLMWGPLGNYRYGWRYVYEG